MRTFEVAVALPHYSPIQALHMQQDERFHQWVAQQGHAQRTVLANMHLSADGMAYETNAQVTCSGQMASGRLLALLREAEPQLTYNETTRFTLPPHAAVEVEVLSPSMAVGCVEVHVDINYSAVEGGTCRSMRGTVHVGSRWWLPERTRAWVEESLTTQLIDSLQASSQRAVAWAETNPDIYPNS